MPTSAIAPPGFFSTISWAIRTSVRRMSSWPRTTVAFDAKTDSFLASRDRVKGTDADQSNSGSGGCCRGSAGVAPVQDMREQGVDHVPFVDEARLLHDPPRGDGV